MPLSSPEQRNFSELPPISLYVHIPWCIRKCPYCDFNSHESKEEIPEDAYVDALLEDLASEMPGIWGRSISSVFVGGGTPSLFSARSIDRLLSGIRSLTAMQPTAEVTMEANPGTFEQEKFKDFRAAGINRLSIGVQSFNAKYLSSLGRVHSDIEAHNAVDIARQAGFDQINLDLMFALPEQTLADLKSDINIANEMATTHLSFYELTLEPNTYFSRFPPSRLPDNDQCAQMQDIVSETLATHGFDRYEVSAYARQTDRNRCRHNMNYWQFGDYLGIGAGAHGKISSAADGSITRRLKKKHPLQYLSAQNTQDRISTETIIPIEESALEFLMNALRLREGFLIPMFQLHTGVDLHRWQKPIERAIEKNLLVQSGMSLQATPTGFNWLNEILQEFLPAENKSATDENAGLQYPVFPVIADKSHK